MPFSRETSQLRLIGVLNPSLAYTFSLLGLTQTTAGMSALLWAAEPILSIGFVWLLFCERATWTLLILVAVMAIVRLQRAAATLL